MTPAFREDHGELLSVWLLYAGISRVVFSMWLL